MLVPYSDGKGRRVAAALVFAYVAAMLVLPPLVGLRIDYSWLLTIYLYSAIPALTLPWIIWRRLHAIQPAVETTVMTLTMLPPQLVITFVVMRSNIPLADRMLIGMDRFIGFDWPQFVKLVDRSASAAWLLGTAYASVFVQIVLMPAALCFLALPGRAYRLVCCYAMLAISATTVAAFFPALSAYAAYGLDVHSLTNVDARNSWGFDAALVRLRTDPNFVLGPATANGIVTFPSIHAGMAMLLIWAAWPTLLRVPSILLNGLMIAGAVTHGAHHLVDVIAGVLAAVVATMWSERLSAAREQDRVPTCGN